MSRYTRRLTSIRFEDANGLGMTVGPSEGDWTAGPHNAEYAEHQPVYNRDQHDGFTLGQDQVVELGYTLQHKLETMTHATLERINDFLLKRGKFSNAVSVDATIWAFKAICTYIGSGVTTTRTYPKVEGEIAGPNDGQPSNTLALSLRSHLKPIDA